jgi:stage II sporulation protein D
MAMSLPTRFPIHIARRSGRALVGVVTILSLAWSGALLGAPGALADSPVKPKSGDFTVHGAGWGHGWGMSQYGAYGAAREGLSWKKIIAFYYPGTKLHKLAAGTTIKVWITADNDGELKVLPAKGLAVHEADGKSYRLPTGSRYKLWRISRSGAGYRLSYKDDSGDWHTKSTPLGDHTWSFKTSANKVTIKMPSGSRREYRGSALLIKRGSSGRTVNKLSVENYVRSVVPAEMPTSWSANAVRAQAVAARTYAMKLASRASSGYDVCDTTSCQVYPGYAVTSGGRRTVRETSGGNAATKATAGTIVRYRGAVALTQFASSNGGHSAQGDYAYLSPHADPYDGVVVSQAWKRTISAAAVGRAWPSVGKVTKVKVTSRDGEGRWGGRVRKIQIIGSKKTITVTGTTFQYRFGLRSTLFTFGG